MYYYNICSYIKIRVLLRFNFNFVHQQHIFDVYIYRAVSTIRSNLPSYQIVMQTVKNIDSGKIEISLTIPPSSIFNAYEWYLLIRLWIERLNENRERIQTIKNSNFLITFWKKKKNLIKFQLVRIEYNLCFAFLKCYFSRWSTIYSNAPINGTSLSQNSHGIWKYTHVGFW